PDRHRLRADLVERSGHRRAHGAGGRLPGAMIATMIRVEGPSMSLTRPLGRRSGSTGFTLVELLVVISITALLVALLLPALGKAKAAAQMSVCASNLRNITVATQLYASDWRQYGPVGLPADQSEYARW